MGFHRQGMPAPRALFDRGAIADAVARLIAAEEVAFANAGRDPFAIDHDCLNPAGHDFIGSCGEVACVHCWRLAWA